MEPASQRRDQNMVSSGVTLEDRSMCPICLRPRLAASLAGGPLLSGNKNKPSNGDDSVWVSCPFAREMLGSVLLVLLVLPGESEVEVRKYLLG